MEEQVKKKTTGKKVLNIILDVLVTLFVIFAILVTILAFASQSSADGVPSIGGKCILTVQTESMAPTFNAGDIIIGQKLNEEQQKSLQAGDIISFDAGDLNMDGKRDINSHRIVEVYENEYGQIYYLTKGDNNIGQDNDMVNSTMVICKYTGTQIKGMGKFLDFLQQPKGFLIVIVLPLLLFFLFELYKFIKKLIEVKNEGKPKISAEEEELIKQEAIAEYLRQQKEQEEAQKAPSEDEPFKE